MRVAAIRGASSYLLNDVSNYLSEQEKVEYKNIGPSRSADWLVGRVALKCAYYAYRKETQPLFTQLAVSKRSTGQPFLPADSNLFCSLAHSHGWGIGALSLAPVGVDIEKVRPHTPHLLTYVATPYEADLAHDAEDAASLITKLWTIKEAVLKGLGVGLQVPPRQVRILSKPSSGSFMVEVEPAHQPCHWEVFVHREDDYFISIAYPQSSNDKPYIGWYLTPGL